MTTVTKTPAEMSPSEIDTILSKLYPRRSSAARDVEWNKGRVEKAKDSPMLKYAQYDLDEAEKKLAAVRAEIAPYDEQHAERRWKRYFLVLNGNGHVHRGMYCPTCFPTTRYGWLPELSGCDEIEMVKVYGEKACSVCFEDAPSMAKMLLEKYGPCKVAQDAAAKKAAREARKAELAAKKAAAAIANPDGTPLKTSWGYPIPTVTQAKLELNRCAEALSSKWSTQVPDADSKRKAYQDSFERTAAALAHKLGKDAEELKRAALKKAEKELALYRRA